jgi:hypothetical protein
MVVCWLRLVLFVRLYGLCGIGMKVKVEVEVEDCHSEEQGSWMCLSLIGAGNINTSISDLDMRIRGV